MPAIDIAHAFTALCAESSKDAHRYWSDDVVSIEAMPGPFQIARGRAELEAKHAAWGSMMTVHGVKTEGPFVMGDQFVVRFELDATGPDGKRFTMTEAGLYTVKGNLITEERFMPLLKS